MIAMWTIARPLAAFGLLSATYGARLAVDAGDATAAAFFGLCAGVCGTVLLISTLLAARR